MYNRCGRCVGLAGLGSAYLTAIFGKDSPILNASGLVVPDEPTPLPARTLSTYEVPTYRPRPTTGPLATGYGAPTAAVLPIPTAVVVPDVPSPATGEPSVVVRAGASSLGPWPFIIAGAAFVMLAKARR